MSAVVHEEAGSHGLAHIFVASETALEDVSSKPCVGSRAPYRSHSHKDPASNLLALVQFRIASSTSIVTITSYMQYTHAAHCLSYMYTRGHKVSSGRKLSMYKDAE